ncbi:MAG: ester cyclase [Roseiflexaceae bacterium]
MSIEDYKALTLRLYTAIGEVFRTGDIGLLDPLLAPDMIDHTPASGPVMGREPGKQLIASFARAFPDTTLTVDLMVAEADRVAAFVSYRSTHTGPFLGHLPTGKAVQVTGMDIMRYRDGRVIELWSQFDDLGVFQQLGLFPGSADTLPSAEGSEPVGDDVAGIIPHGARR